MPTGLSCKDLCALRIYTNGGTKRREQISVLYCHTEGRVDAPSGNTVPYIKKKKAILSN